MLQERALNQTFAMWRDRSTGNPVCHSAFCPHLGANLAAGDKINSEGRLVCPFHSWEFNPDGSVHSIPYLKDPSKVLIIRFRSLCRAVSDEAAGSGCNHMQK